jgi:acyl carrier protein
MDGGRLFLTGRIKELIIVRGRNFHPHEIEEAVRNAHPALSATAAAFSVTTDVEESLVVVCEVRRNRRNGALQEVLLAIQGELVRRLDVKADVIGLVKPGAIPRTTSGKVQRLKCRTGYVSDLFHFLAFWPVPAAAAAGRQTAGREAAVTSSNNGAGDSAAKPMRFVIENWIGEWLSYRLRIPVENIDPRQPFSDYGLDSLAAVQLSQAIEDWLEVPVPETLAWSYPTPEALSVYIEQALRKFPHEATVAAEPRSKAFHSEVDLALQWVERLTEPEVEHLYRRRLVKE